MQIQHKDTGWSKHKSERLLKQAYLTRVRRAGQKQGDVGYGCFYGFPGP